MKGLMRDDSGQAIVEYVLGIAIAMMIVSVLAIGFRKSLLRIWQAMSRDISAACAGCPPEQNIRFR